MMGSALGGSAYLKVDGVPAVHTFLDQGEYGARMTVEEVEIAYSIASEEGASHRAMESNTVFRIR